MLQTEAYDTFTVLLDAVQAKCKVLGFGVAKKRGSNRDATGQYTRFDLKCIRGLDRSRYQTTGKRQGRSRRA
jgi:hypothetical protein